jgi:hypothetical protein
MVNFKQFIQSEFEKTNAYFNLKQFQEIANLSTLDTSKIDLIGKVSWEDEFDAKTRCLNQQNTQQCIEDELKKIPKMQYKGVFSHEENNYEVKINRVTWSTQSKLVRVMQDSGIAIQQIHDLLKNVFNIAFRGPRGYQTTKLNSGAAIIYDRFLTFIKKLSEIEALDGLMFKPAEKPMALIYNRFITKTDLKLVDDEKGVYLHKNLINKIIGLAKNDNFVNYISHSNGAHEKNLENIRRLKILKRELIGKWVVKNNGEFAIIERIEFSSYNKDIIMSKIWYVEYNNVKLGFKSRIEPLDDLRKINPILMDELEKIKSQIHDDSVLSGSISRIDGYNGEVYSGDKLKLFP